MQKAPCTTPDLTDSDVDSLFAEVGGRGSVRTRSLAGLLSHCLMLKLDAFNQVIENGSLDQIKMIMAGLQRSLYQ